MANGDGAKNTGRFRSIQTSGNNGGHMKGQPAAMMHNVNFNLINQGGSATASNSGGAQSTNVGGAHHNPNHSIDIGQLPMRLVSQKAGHRKGTN
jgi:hypothetical protein